MVITNGDSLKNSMDTDNQQEPKRESVSRLRAETEAVDYHCNYCTKKIGDYAAVCGALRAASVSVDKYGRVIAAMLAARRCLWKLFATMKRAAGI